MSFQDRLKEAKTPRIDAVEKLNRYIEALPKEEQLALRELIISYPQRHSYDALREEGYKLTRDTIAKWKNRYVV
jgi:hypothetical protein